MENKFLGITPPMGWNSWNTFTWEINDKLIREAADAFVSEGLKDAGSRPLEVPGRHKARG